MTAGPIPASAVDRWTDRNCMGDLDDVELFRVLIRTMDGVFLAHVGKDAREQVHSGTPAHDGKGQTLSPALFKAIFAKPSAG